MENRQQNVTRQYLQQSNLENMAAATLSLKQRAFGEKLDSIKASQNMRHFLNLLNKKAFGNSASRQGVKVEVIPVLETSTGGRLHYHLAIENPQPEQPFWFEIQIEKLWKKTRWGYSENNIQHGADAGWVNYITKLGPYDEVDWENLHRVRRV